MSKPEMKEKLSRSLPWKLVDPSAKYAFSEDAFDQIAGTHGVTHDQVARLAMDLVHPLSLNFRPMGVLEFLYQEKRGAISRSSVIQKLERVQKDLKDISTLVTNLTVYGNEDPFDLLRRIEALNSTLPSMLNDVSDALVAFKKSERNREAIFDRDAVNNRRDSDERRPAILNCIFCFWEELGRPLTPPYSSNAVF